MSKKVLVALSGGVDSTVAALNLAEAGYEIVGAHMKLWDYVDVGGDIFRDGRCCSLDSVTDCRFVCDKLGVPFYLFNFSEEFKARVIEDFVSEYRVGRTPNPCIRCNTLIKWEMFLRKAAEIGCDSIATGHYSTIEQNSVGRFQIRMGVDQTRDQSYVLWGLSQEALSRTLMPLGPMQKSEVRETARKHGLKTADKPESREICFVADDDYRRFLREYTNSGGPGFEPGEIVHVDGRVMGQHQGTALFTIGQRRGLGIGYSEPLYVQKLDVGSKRVIVGESEFLLENECVVNQVNWSAISAPKEPIKALVKIRYLHAPAQAMLYPHNDDSLTVRFEKAQRAIAPGQSAVFYDHDILLGGGIIDRV